jgi:hypothetical protein
MGIITVSLYVFFCLIHKRKFKERSSILHASYPEDLSYHLIREFYKDILLVVLSVSGH